MWLDTINWTQSLISNTKPKRDAKSRFVTHAHARAHANLFETILKSPLIERRREENKQKGMWSKFQVSKFLLNTP